MKDSRAELQTEANRINRVISRILLFHYGDVIWWPFIYFFFYFWGSISTQKPRNSIQHVSVDRVSLCDFFLSIHIIRWCSLDTGYKKKWSYWFFHFIICPLEMERPCDFIRTLTQLYRRSHRRYNCVFRFSTALRGGKPAAAAALIGGINCNFRLSSALRGGKLAVAALPPLS